MPSPRKLQSGDNEALVKGSTSPIGSVRAPLGYRGEIWTTSLEQKLSALRLINQSLEQSPPAESHVGRSSSVASRSPCPSPLGVFRQTSTSSPSACPSLTTLKTLIDKYDTP